MDKRSGITADSTHAQAPRRLDVSFPTRANAAYQEDARNFSDQTVDFGMLVRLCFRIVVGPGRVWWMVRQYLDLAGLRRCDIWVGILIVDCR
jgi:hypothetical protein